MIDFNSKISAFGDKFFLSHIDSVVLKIKSLILRTLGGLLILSN